MNNAQVDRQLALIKKIHSRLHIVLADETLDGMESLADELKSRMTTVLGMMNRDQLSDENLAELNDLIMKQRELIAMMESRLKTFSAKLVAARKKTMVSRKYRISPAKFNAEQAKSMDIEG